MDAAGRKAAGRAEIGAGRFGASVALSPDGKPAAIGGPGDNEGVGAAWVFRRRGSTWAQRGSKLTGSDEIDQARSASNCQMLWMTASDLSGGDPLVRRCCFVIRDPDAVLELHSLEHVSDELVAVNLRHLTCSASSSL